MGELQQFQGEWLCLVILWETSAALIPSTGSYWIFHVNGVDCERHYFSFVSLQNNGELRSLGHFWKGLGKIMLFPIFMSKYR